MASHLENYLRFCLGQSTSEILNKNIENFTNDEIFSYKQELETNHQFIQWVFPTPRPSNYNSNAPILTVSQIDSIKSIPTVINLLEDYRNFFFDYWGIYPENSERIKILNGHNGLRLSRAIECLTLFDIDIEYIFPILEKYIENGVLRPKMEKYKHERLPIWFIRRIENR